MESSLLSIYEAKAHFSAIAERVSAFGERVTVTKHGKPLLRIVPLEDNAALNKQTRIAQSLADLLVLQANGGARLSKFEILDLKNEGRKW